MIRNAIALALLFSLTGCISPNPERTDFAVTTGSVSLDLSEPVSFANDIFDISFFRSRRSNGLIERISGMYSVDGDTSARDYLMRNFDICIISVRNKTFSDRVFCLNRLSITADGLTVTPICPGEMPKEIARLDPKGIVKNIYNYAAQLTCVIGYIALISLLSDGKADPHIGADALLPINEYQSNILHKTGFRYDDLISPENPIPGSSVKSGVIFVRKGAIRDGRQVRIDYE